MKKVLFIIITLLSIFSYGNAKINVFVDVNRFKDVKNHTKFEIAYQIPYNQLSFQRIEKGYRALIKIKLSLIKNGKVVFTKPLLRQLLETNNVIDSEDFSYQDKLHFSLSKPGFTLKLTFVDMVKKDSLVFEKELINLEPNDFLSDLELDYIAKKDTTDYMKNFKRGDYLYLGNQNHVFDKVTQNPIYIYYEVYQNNENNFRSNLEVVSNDSIIYSKKVKELTGLPEGINKMLYTLPITNFKPGYYKLIFDMKNLNTGKSIRRQSFFIIKEKRIKEQLVFYNIKDDVALVRYFLNSSQKKILRSLKDDKSKNNFISKFWRTHDPNPATEQNEFLELIKKRINYANENFSYFIKGWKTDRGRIYIKYGEPDFKKKYRTDSSSKYPFKYYVVWQYKSGRDQTYIFFDIQSSGSFRLIYSRNDPTETSYPNWKIYVGEEFDMNDLE